MNTFLQRFKEPSTWRGLFMLATALGLNVSPELQEHILSGGMALVGAVGMFTGDKQ